MIWLIREQDPLKQGLKPGYHAGIVVYCSIREQDPLKQGLKPTTQSIAKVVGV